MCAFGAQGAPRAISTIFGTRRTPHLHPPLLMPGEPRFPLKGPPTPRAAIEEALLKLAARLKSAHPGTTEDLALDYQLARAIEGQNAAKQDRILGPNLHVTQPPQPSEKKSSGTYVRPSPTRQVQANPPSPDESASQNSPIHGARRVEYRIPGGAELADAARPSATKVSPAIALGDTDPVAKAAGMAGMGGVARNLVGEGAKDFLEAVPVIGTGLDWWLLDATSICSIMK